MGKVHATIEVNAPVEDCFSQWTRFEEFPSFMANVKDVTRIENDLYHWVVDGPMGLSVEWDAKMDSQIHDRMISWHTIESSPVAHEGAVKFLELSPGTTRITTEISYEPIAGAIGEGIADLLSNPEKMVQQDLENFKKLVEAQRVMSPL